MIYLDTSPPDKSKEFRYKSMFIKKSQETFTIDAKGINVTLINISPL